MKNAVEFKEKFPIRAMKHNYNLSPKEALRNSEDGGYGWHYLRYLAGKLHQLNV